MFLTGIRKIRMEIRSEMHATTVLILRTVIRKIQMEMESVMSAMEMPMVTVG